MKLSDNTKQVIKNFATINSSLLFQKGAILTTIAPNKTCLARAKLDQEFPKTFGIYDVPRFLSVVSLFKEPELEFFDNQVKVYSGNHKILYTYTDPENIKTVPPDKNVKLPSEDVKFTLHAEVLASIIKAASALSVEDIGIIGDGEALYLKAFNSNDPTGDSYSIKVSDTDKTINEIIKVEYLKLLPVTYNVTISSKALVYFQSERVEYWIPLESK